VDKAEFEICSELLRTADVAILTSTSPSAAPPFSLHYTRLCPSFYDLYHVLPTYSLIQCIQQQSTHPYSLLLPPPPPHPQPHPPMAHPANVPALSSPQNNAKRLVPTGTASLHRTRAIGAKPTTPFSSNGLPSLKRKTGG
jgi:hypothetical protein